MGEQEGKASSVTGLQSGRAPASGGVSRGNLPPPAQAGQLPQDRAAARRFLLFAAALLAAVLIAYWPAWQGEPIIDDDIYVTPPALRSPHGLWRIWSDLSLCQTRQYDPVLHSAFWVQAQLWGDSTLGYHLVNIALHALAAMLFALILRRLEIPGAYLAAAIFALHPAHVSSVAWMTELKNVLSAVFYLGAALAYLRFDRTRRERAYALAAVLFVMGLLSKNVAATLPAALLVVIWWKRGRLIWNRDVLPLLPFLLVGVGYGLFTIWIERTLIRSVGNEYSLTLVQRGLLAGRAFWFYLGKLFWPAELLFVYPRWKIDIAAGWQYLPPIGVLLALVALWLLRRRSRAPLAAMLLFLGTLLPALGFFKFGWFQFSFVADHLRYLPSLAVIALSAAALAKLSGCLKRWGMPALCAVGVLLAATLGFLTWRHSRQFTQAETFYRTILASNPECDMAHYNLGTVLARRSEWDVAIEHFREALRIRPEAVDAHNNLGAALMAKGDRRQAIEHFREALRIDPNCSEAHNGLGGALIDRDSLQAAFKAPNDMAAALARDNLSEAIEHFREALRIWPQNSQASRNLSLALTWQRELNEATERFRRAQRGKPD
jgi:tetratricopeptide (TPR) repeat protein